jgi:hypothetical protein
MAGRVLVGNDQGSRERPTRPCPLCEVSGIDDHGGGQEVQKLTMLITQRNDIDCMRLISAISDQF